MATPSAPELFSLSFVVIMYLLYKKSVTEKPTIKVSSISSPPLSIHKREKTKDSGFFFLKVVGVTAQNEDGVSRQAIIAKCSAGDKLTLRAEPTNKYDKNAVGIWHKKGKIGYLNSAISKEILNKVEKGKITKIHIECMTGKGKKTQGVNIKLFKL